LDLRQYARILRARWLLIAAVTLLTLLVAAVFAWTRTPLYRAEVQLFISARVPADLSEVYQGVLFSQQRVRSYAQLVSSPPVAERVIAQLDLPETVDDLQGKIDVSVPPDTVLIDVAVTDPSAPRAKQIADAVGTEFAAFINALESSGADPSPVQVAVTSPAQLPTAPISPRKPLILLLGFHLGLILGIATAAAAEALQRRVRSAEDAAMLAGAPVLGAVVERSSRAGDVPVAFVAPESAEAEAYRRVRTNVQALTSQGLDSFVVASAARHDAQTEFIANLGIVFAQAGYSVVLIDANLREPRLADVFGARSATGLTEVLTDGLSVEDVTHTWRSDLPLKVLAAGGPVPNPSELLGSDRFATAIDAVSSKADIVLLDAPPLDSASDAVILARAVSGAILTARLGTTRASELAYAENCFRTVGARIVGIVLLHKRARDMRGHAGYVGDGKVGAAWTPRPISDPDRPVDEREFTSRGRQAS
jgi:polysaccharide biosynthesis transport protein